jgi:hypothetical protein
LSFHIICHGSIDVTIIEYHDNIWKGSLNLANDNEVKFVWEGTGISIVLINWDIVCFLNDKIDHSNILYVINYLSWIHDASYK